MATKAFFVVALLVAAIVGLLLPTPGASTSKSQPTKSQFQTLELRGS